MDYCKAEQIMIFVDLDNTLFQTKRKDLHAVHPASEAENPLNGSFMNDAQKAFLELMMAHQNSRIIPVTARDRNQYGRAFISRDSRVQLATLYFGAEILIQNKIDSNWKNHIDSCILNLSISIGQLHQIIKSKVKHYGLEIKNIDGYYIVIKHSSKDDYQNVLMDCFLMLSSYIPNDYRLYHNDNNISIVPRCLDKKNAVQYIIEKNKPVLTIGVGDSNSDWEFMDSCQYKIIPQNSQINQKINTKLFIDE
jgi:hydroxymethylpyrimidine pyrophosphatase-like HAD family hydrolase